MAKYVIKQNGKYLGAGFGAMDGVAWYDNPNAPEVMKSTQSWCEYFKDHMTDKGYLDLSGAQVVEVPYVR